MLSNAGLAQSGRSDREQLWQIEARRLGEVRLLLERIAAQWDEALGRLTAYVERQDPADQS